MFSKSKNPLGSDRGGKPDPASSLYNLLFGDSPLDGWRSNDPLKDSEYPWSTFAEARSAVANRNPQAAIAALKKLADDVGMESRHRLQAWHHLRTLGHNPGDNSKTVFGVIVEIGLDRGVDIVAAYADHHARYINQGGAIIVWERPDGSIDKDIDTLMEVGEAVCNMIGPWKDSRMGPPARNIARVNFLTPSGLHFGQGPLEQFAQDQMAGPVIAVACKIMKSLIEKAGRQGSKPNINPT
jgi:hypothetical protein